MTLPFPEPTGGRTYVCFVCGFTFKDVDEYFKHIVDTHEEGREFVKCPLSRCQACVRDVRLHFKIYHPKETIPKNCQLKALIWTDTKDVKRRRKPTFKEGYFISTKNNGAKMHYRSGFEKEVYECLEKLDEVVSYQVEPFFVHYYHKGKKRKYFPDLKINFKGKVEIWEVKPMNQTFNEQNRAKWLSCSEYCKIRDWKFEVLTEKGFKTLKNKVSGNILFSEEETDSKEIGG